MKRSIATTLLAATLVSFCVEAHAPGTLFTNQEWKEWVSAQPHEHDLILLKDGTSLTGTVTTIPTTHIAGNAIHFNPDQLTIIATAFVEDHPKIQWMTLSGYSFITDIPSDSIVLSDKKIPLQSIDTILFHNQETSGNHSLASVELKNGDVFPIHLLSDKVESSRGQLLTADFYDVLFDGGLHGTLRQDGKYQFFPHTTLVEPNFHGQVPYVNDILVFNWNQVNRVQSDTNGFIDQSRTHCHDKSCEEALPGIFTISYLNHEDTDDETWAVLDPMLAGAFAFASEGFTALLEPSADINEPKDPAIELQPKITTPPDFAINELHIRSLPDVVFFDSFASESEKLFEEIYLSQLNEELQLMNDYDELLTALSNEEEKKLIQQKHEDLKLEHDYHELLSAYSYNHEFDLLTRYRENLQSQSDYDELMDALAVQDIDKKAFDIKFNDASSEEDSNHPQEAIDFAALFQAVEWQLQPHMEERELAYISRVLENSESKKAESNDSEKSESVESTDQK